LDRPGFLAAVGLHQGRLLAAALFQLIAAFTSERSCRHGWHRPADAERAEGP
jgi:hypothetical protein